MKLSPKEVGEVLQRCQTVSSALDPELRRPKQMQHAAHFKGFTRVFKAISVDMQLISVQPVTGWIDS